MAALTSEGRSAVDGPASGLRGMEVVSGPYPITRGLPVDHVSICFTTMEDLTDHATRVYDSLCENDGQGNQFILVQRLPSEILSSLVNNRDTLESIPFRLEFDGDTVLIKVVPGFQHDTATATVRAVLADKLTLMGVPRRQARWGTSSIMRAPGSNSGKEADEILWPENRRPLHDALRGWPTLVIETGNSESRPRLRADVKRWFGESNGDVRIVITIKILRNKVEFQKWILLPQNAPNPAPRQYLLQVRQRAPHMPPLTPQPAASQQAVSVQEVTVWRNRVVGAPMILPFHALMDRPPQQNESDLSITSAEFREICEVKF